MAGENNPLGAVGSGNNIQNNIPLNTGGGQVTEYDAPSYDSAATYYRASLQAKEYNQPVTDYSPQYTYSKKQLTGYDDLTGADSEYINALLEARRELNDTKSLRGKVFFRKNRNSA